MRFYDTTPRPLTVSQIGRALRKADPAFLVGVVGRRLAGTLSYSDEEHAQIEINTRRQELFRNELAEMLEEVVQSKARAKSSVERTLRDARRVIAVEVLFGKRDLETTLSRLDMLWKWLFNTRSGLLQADGEGFYNRRGLILPVK
jgi:hypothetical protein